MEEVKTCGRCNRVLKTAQSKEHGYGPVCWKKVQQQKEGGLNDPRIGFVPDKEIENAIDDALKGA